MSRVVRLMSAALLCCASTAAQQRDVREATVGMRAYVDQVVLAGTALAPVASTSKSPLMVRVIKAWPHGQHLRYDLEWVGFEPGTYDLTDYLAREDGSTTDDLPALKVEVVSVLPADMFEPSALEAKPGDALGGYSQLQVGFILLWVTGLLAILFLGRARKPAAAVDAVEPTLADRLRPLVDRVSRGDAEEHQKAELERLLVAFWRARLDLGEMKIADAVMTIRADERAGALLRHVEEWLHAPNPPEDVDVGELLAPYRTVTADALQPEAR